jgi:hypothetical protein
MAATSTNDPQEVVAAQQAVAEYEDAKAMLEAFKQQNGPLIEQLRQFLEHYNQTREAAEKAVRAAGISCGDFDLYQQVNKVDGEKALSSAGREKFIRIGGSVKTTVSAKIGIKQWDTALARGEIDTETYEECKKLENRYHTPESGALP